jgi:hypothetical protein
MLSSETPITVAPAAANCSAWVENSCAWTLHPTV